MTEPQRITLPDVLIKAIDTITSNADMTPSERVSATMLIVFGWAKFDSDKEQIDGRQIQLFEPQWLTICEMLTSGVPDDRITSVNLGLSWMNQGPSTFKEGS